eukprot:m.485908 g.485908  ORF g.485908 m.485908 type:complete len:302 (+) comp24063_c0_seq1:72-977(+)
MAAWLLCLIGAATVLVDGAVAAPAPNTAPPCRSDEDCLHSGTQFWRCGKSPAHIPGGNCHLPGPGTAGNASCVCGMPKCAQGNYNKPEHPDWKQYLMIGDSISMGQKELVFNALTAHNVEAQHNPGNAASSNLGDHCLDAWTLASERSWDLISFNFGLHDLGYDTERINLDEYTLRMQSIVRRLSVIQGQQGTKLLWVTTTPVPTVPVYGPGCNVTSRCLNPPRFDADVRLYNKAANEIVAASNATIATLDLYSFVLKKCGGVGYTTCPGFQLPSNVHYYPAGWQALANQTVPAVLAQLTS